MLPPWRMEESTILYKNSFNRQITHELNIFFRSIQQTDAQQLNAQMISAQKTQQLIENNNNNNNNNNQPLIDPTQKKSSSRPQENNIIDRNSLQLDNHTKSPNDSHYIKNKTLQSPVNRYKVCCQ